MALVTLAGAQAAMVLVMSVTSLHLYHHHGGLADVSLVIILHTLGMFGLSMLSGALADRLGQRAVIGAGVLLLMLGSLLAPLSTATLWLAFALFIIGLGWNLCYIAGSSLLTASLEPIERSRIQGAAELAVNLSSATIGLSSGAIFAVFGYHTLARIGAALMLIPLALMCWQGVAQRKGLAFRSRERAYRAVGRKGEAHHTP
jgi:MFS family permease